jgi:hypothetical protein
MEFHSALKKGEIMLFAGKQMELENFVLNKVSQAQAGFRRLSVSKSSEMQG